MLKRRFRVAGCVGLPIEPSMSTATSLTSLSSYAGPSTVHHSLSQDSLIDPPRFQQRSPMVSPSARYETINIRYNNQIPIIWCSFCLLNQFYTGNLRLIDHRLLQLCHLKNAHQLKRLHHLCLLGVEVLRKFD